MEDESGVDAKLIAVPVEKTVPMYKQIQSTADLPELLLNQIEHFFDTTRTRKRQLGQDPGLGRQGSCKQEIIDGVKRYGSRRQMQASLLDQTRPPHR